MNSRPYSYSSEILSYFAAFANNSGSFLFDSGKPHQEQGRYDLFSAWPTETLAINTSDKLDLPALKNKLSNKWQSCDSELPFCGGWMGFASYELAYKLQTRTGNAKQTNQLPLFYAAYYSWAFIVDHQLKTATLVYEDDIDPALLGRIESNLKQTPIQQPSKAANFKLLQSFSPQTSWQQYQQDFQAIQEYLQQGDCYQVNYSQCYQSRYQGDAFAAYQRLRTAVPSPFMSYIQLKQHTLLSISPERFLQASGAKLQTKPIKGTAARSPCNEIDAELAQALQQSEKNRAENLMIVDLLRNDFGAQCKLGSVKVDELFAIESYANVHHLVSTINAELDDDKNIWDAFFSAFPGGSITGAPKVRACQIINELEHHNREIYCGTIFYASNNGEFDANIAIRTLLADGDNIFAWAGGGIVKDSTASEEYQECSDKISKLLQALETS